MLAGFANDALCYRDDQEKIRFRSVSMPICSGPSGEPAATQTLPNNATQAVAATGVVAHASAVPRDATADNSRQTSLTANIQSVLDRSGTSRVFGHCEGDLFR